MPVGVRPQPPTGVAKVTYKGLDQGTNWENVFWADITGSLTFSNIGTFATDCYGVYQTNLLPNCSTNVTLEEVVVIYYDGAGNVEGSSSASHAGSKSGATLPSNCCTLLSWKIPATWRGGKPRTYLPPPSGSELGNAHTWSSAHTAAVQTGAGNFRTAFNALTLSGVTGVKLATVSFQHANAWRTPPIAYEYVAVGVQSRICTQRRRLGVELF